MLNAYKQMYKKCADIIPGWQRMSKNDLIRAYRANRISNPFLANAYMAGIMYKYWGAINKYYLSSYRSATKEDCNEWLIHAIMYGVNNAKWEDPKNKLYLDKNGPDKVMNRCIASTRMIFYQSANSDVRRVNFTTSSIEELEENNHDYILPKDNPYTAGSDEIYWINDLIRREFRDGDKFSALVLEGIIYGDVFKADKITKHLDNFDVKKLARHIRSFSVDNAKDFAKSFDLDFESVYKFISKASKYSSALMYKHINASIDYLKIKLADYLR